MFLARHIRAAARRARGPAMRIVAESLMSFAGGSISFGETLETIPQSTPKATPSSLAPMRFVRVTSGSSACQPNCPEWISAEGKIVMGTADALARVVKGLNGRRLPIFVNSAGGSVEDAMAMGRLIRAKQLAVVVAHTLLTPCPASEASCGEARGAAETNGAYCASACALVLAGGADRYVSPLSFVGVHQLTEVVRKTTVKRSYAVRYFAIAWFRWEVSRKLVHERRLTAMSKHAADRDVDDKVAAYLDDMGIGRSIMELTLATPSRDVRWLTPEELAASRLATIRVDGVSPIVDNGGADGLAGEPLDDQSGSASLFVAKSETAPEEGRSRVEGAFAYRRGGGAVLATLLAPPSPSSPVQNLSPGVGPMMILYPDGPRFGIARAAPGQPARVAIPVRDFCGMAGGGHAVITLIEGGGDDVHSSATAVDLPLTADARSLFDEACSRVASASR